MVHGICSQAPARWDVSQRKEIASKDLKRGLEGLATNLFGNVEMRWVDAYFPFTTPSAELEILFRVSCTYCRQVEEVHTERANGEDFVTVISYLRTPNSSQTTNDT